MTYWYISFATDDKFLGATVIEAPNDMTAFFKAGAMGRNPGGQAAITEVPESALKEPDVQAMMAGLLNEEQMLSFGGIKHKDMNEQMKQEFDRKFMIMGKC